MICTTFRGRGGPPKKKPRDPDHEARCPAQAIQLRGPEEKLALVFEAKLELETDFSTKDIRTVSLGGGFIPGQGLCGEEAGQGFLEVKRGLGRFL